MLGKRTKSENELRSLENKFFSSVKNKSPEQDKLWKEYQEKRKKMIIEGFEKSKYDIAGDLKLIAEELKEKYPSIASDALELVDTYSAKTKEKK